MSAWSRNSITYARYNGTTHSISATTSSATHTTAVASQVRLVRVFNGSGQTVFLSDPGAAPTAATSDMPLADGATEYFLISPGEKIAAITASGSGTVYVSEMIT